MMKRRNFFAASAFALSVSILPIIASAGEFAEDFVDYTPEVLEKSLSSGETVFIDFHASWCPTCAAQGRVIKELRAENPAYDENITFMLADWDTWSKSEIISEMKIPRRSTLVVLRGDEELGRIVAGTAKEEIGALLDTALEK